MYRFGEGHALVDWLRTEVRRHIEAERKRLVDLLNWVEYYISYYNASKSFESLEGFECSIAGFTLG